MYFVAVYTIWFATRSYWEFNDTQNEADHLFSKTMANTFKIFRHKTNV